MIKSFPIRTTLRSLMTFLLWQKSILIPAELTLRACSQVRWVTTATVPCLSPDLSTLTSRPRCLRPPGTRAVSRAMASMVTTSPSSGALMTSTGPTQTTPANPSRLSPHTSGCKWKEMFLNQVRGHPLFTNLSSIRNVYHSLVLKSSSVSNKCWYRSK